MKSKSSEDRVRVQAMQDLQYAREKIEDGMKVLQDLRMDTPLTQALKDKIQANILEGLKKQRYIHKYLMVACTETADIAEKFAQEEDTSELTVEELKRVRELKKEDKSNPTTPPTAPQQQFSQNKTYYRNRYQYSPYQHPQQSMSLQPPQAAYMPNQQSAYLQPYPPYGTQQPTYRQQQPTTYMQPLQSTYQYPPSTTLPTGYPQQSTTTSPIKRSGRWPAWMNKCNTCDQEGHWSGSCPTRQTQMFNPAQSALTFQPT